MCGYRAIPAILIVLLSPHFAQAKDPLPTIRATSKVVTVIDGIHVKKNYWYIMPEKEPDVYYAEIPRRPGNTVTFVTDIDTIHVPVSYGSRYPFIIELGNGERALTEVRGEYKTLLPYQISPSLSATGPYEIPFTMGDNDKIYVKASINGSPLLDFQFDLGAGGGIIKKGSLPKVEMTFDRNVTLTNSDGVNEVPASSVNRIEMAGLIWDNVDFTVADNMTHREDGLLGNFLFKDKVLEINYTEMVMRVHDALPELSGDWHRQDIYLDGGTVPHAKGTLSIGDAAKEGWLMLDTGAYTSILHAEELSMTSKFASEFRRLLAPFGVAQKKLTISLGGQTFSDINYSVMSFKGDTEQLGVLGNDVLKRFDTVLDNQNGAVWFRPNANMAAGFRNPERKIVQLVPMLLFAAGVVFFWRKKKQRARRG